MNDETVIAERIRTSVTTVYPDVAIDMWIEGSAQVLSFVPVNDDAASVTVTVSGSIVVEAMFFKEDLAEQGSLEKQTTMAIGIVLSLADNGLAKVRQPLPQFPFTEVVYGPASGYWGIDELALTLLGRPVQVLGPWSTHVPDSD